MFNLFIKDDYRTAHLTGTKPISMFKAQIIGATVAGSILIKYLYL